MTALHPVRRLVPTAAAAAAVALALSACNGVSAALLDTYQSTHDTAQSAVADAQDVIAKAEKLLADSKGKVADDKTRDALAVALDQAKKAGLAVPDPLPVEDLSGSDLSATHYEAAQSGLQVILTDAAAIQANLETAVKNVESSMLRKSAANYGKAKKGLELQIAAGEKLWGESEDAVADNETRDRLEAAYTAARKTLEGKINMAKRAELDKATTAMNDDKGKIEAAMKEVEASEEELAASYSPPASTPSTTRSTTSVTPSTSTSSTPSTTTTTVPQSEPVVEYMEFYGDPSDIPEGWEVVEEIPPGN